MLSAVHRIFVRHPAEVGESYIEHMATAARFGLSMIAGGAACLLHALIPAACVGTGSRTIQRLHERMVLNRIRHGVDPLVHGHSFRDHGLHI